MARKDTESVTPSVPHELGRLIKSARDLMRKDKGLSGELDRIPTLTWIMFLKFLDDFEMLRETEAKLEGKRFRPAVDPPFRWKDWAANPGGVTGEELIAFINQDEVVRPDGTREPGLFAYLRSLRGADGGDRRDVIAAVFRGITNRMTNGYILRDVLNKVQTIQFTSSNQIHTLGYLYETMLRELRDAAGDSGEFYTPRPLVRFIVSVTAPTLSESVLDPAAGTGGFLVETFEHLKKQCKTANDFARLQAGSLFGIEAKPLPYLLCQMNLVLHGLEAPNIDPGNALRFPLHEIGDKDRMDVIMTNPPFGGEEEPGILSNFADDKRTIETALLFLQLIMRKLRRHPRPGRAAVVVPNGTLFGDGVCARIKAELFKDFDLHTILRMPPGIFAPYTSIPTNVIFFNRFGPTKETWYYEQPLPEGKKGYTKTQPLQFEEFAACLSWWPLQKRVENEHAWKVSAAEVIARNYNLDIRNPRATPDFEHLPPRRIVEEMSENERLIMSHVSELKQMLEDREWR